ncbi:MAG: hypothetical protein HEP71_31665 [Roseivirga sp.]|nr:hypothetical protein [Roseivirga sp.]
MSHKILSIHYLSFFIIVCLISPACSSGTPGIACSEWNLKITNGLTIDQSWNEIYISRSTSQKDPNGRNASDIYLLTHDGTSFSSPTLAPFSDPRFIDYHPVFSVDNQQLFFISWRPIPGSDEGLAYGNIWYVERQGEQWSQPIYLDIINQAGHDSYPSLTRDGTLYFNSDRPGGEGGMDIYRSKLENGRYTTPINVASLNSADSENDLFIDPDERFMIFNRYYPSNGQMDMLISFHESDKWSAPQKLDLINQPDVYELTPTISPDGKLFFYELNGKVQCIPIKDLLAGIR